MVASLAPLLRLSWTGVRGMDTPCDAAPSAPQLATSSFSFEVQRLSTTGAGRNHWPRDSSLVRTLEHRMETATRARRRRHLRSRLCQPWWPTFATARSRDCLMMMMNRSLWSRRIASCAPSARPNLQPFTLPMPHTLLARGHPFTLPHADQGRTMRGLWAHNPRLLGVSTASTAAFRPHLATMTTASTAVTRMVRQMAQEPSSVRMPGANPRPLAGVMLLSSRPHPACDLLIVSLRAPRWVHCRRTRHGHSHLA